MTVVRVCKCTKGKVLFRQPRPHLSDFRQPFNSTNTVHNETTMELLSLDPVLVIGGCGCLGHSIVEQLIKDGSASNVAVFDVNTKFNRVDSVKYIQGSLSSRDDVLSALQQTKARVVIHTASPKLMIQSNTRELYTEVNINGTRTLLDCIKEVGTTKALVYTSSSSVVHDNFTNLVNATEDLPLCFEPEQKEYYTHTKAVAEEMICKANKQSGFLTTIIRASMLFGEGDMTSTPQMVQNARAGRGKFQIGDGTNLFDFTFVGNTAYAHILAAKALIRESTATGPIPDRIKVNGEAFVITNDEPWPFWDFTRAMGAAAGYPVKKEDIWVIPKSLYYVFAVISEWVVWASSFGQTESYINRRMVKYLTMTRTFDISKAKKRLGYRPQVGMQEAIKKAVETYLARSADEKKDK
jgi:sterol-4alpha-carboxylate 3-dehydrogenase (decarboxylating)